MKEAFLHYLWKYKLLKPEALCTTEGEELIIEKSGEHNFDSGPDFFNARIKIGTNLWVGNVEVHINSSDWLKHKHQFDKAYDNVILHVVLKEDAPVFRANGERIPTLVLSGAYDEKLYDTYQALMDSKFWVPCQNHLNDIDSFVMNTWLQRMLVERLERKSLEIIQLLEQSNSNWQEVFYVFIARNFGFNINAVPFEQLAKSISLKYLAKHKDNLMQLEALLFGQAGFLEQEFIDEYPQNLKKEYGFLKHKYNLRPIESHLWKFLRLRPVNFPTIRLAQLASLVYASNALFSTILECKEPEQIYKMFDVEPSEYWKNHYKFDVASKSVSKRFGKSSIDILIINTIVPFLFVYGKLKVEEKFQEIALSLLEKIKGESNSITENWNKSGVTIDSAFSTQALIQLKKYYCNEKKCLNCALGNHILKQAGYD